MLEIRTQYSPTRLGLEIFVLRRERVKQHGELEVLQRIEDEDEWYDWVVKNEGESFGPTFVLRQDQVPTLIEDLNRDGMGVDEGAEGTVTKHKDDLKEILDRVLPHALREEV